MDHSVCQPASKPLSQPIHLIQSASQSACQPDNQPTNPSVTKSASHSVSLSANQPLSQPVSLSQSASHSGSQAVGQSVIQPANQPAPQSASQQVRQPAFAWQTWSYIRLVSQSIILSIMKSFIYKLISQLSGSWRLLNQKHQIGQSISQWFSQYGSQLVNEYVLFSVVSCQESV